MSTSKTAEGVAGHQGARRSEGPMRTGAKKNAVEVLRCDCGRLLARVLDAAVELKCARCKRVVIIVGGRRFEEVGSAGCTCLEAFCERRDE